MTEEIRYYRARDPKAVLSGLDRWNEERTAFFLRCEEFVKALGVGGKPVIVGDGERIWLDHIVHYDDIPPGWRPYAKEPGARPNRGGRDADSKAAKAALAELNETSPGALRMFLVREFGAYRQVFRGFGTSHFGDDYFLLYGSSAFDGGLPDWDGGEHWEPIKASEYHLAKEAAAESDEVAP